MGIPLLKTFVFGLLISCGFISILTLPRNRRQNYCSSGDAQAGCSRKLQHLLAPFWDHRAPAQQKASFPTAGAWERMENGFKEKGPNLLLAWLAGVQGVTFSSISPRCRATGAEATAHCQMEKTTQSAAEELLLPSGRG